MQSRALTELAMTPDQDIGSHLPLSAAAFQILVALAHEPRHGYAIAQEVEELSEGSIVMGPGTLYGSLQRMLSAGLIREADNPGDEGIHSDRRRYYKITLVGTRVLEAESTRLLKAAHLARERLSG